MSDDDMKTRESDERDSVQGLTRGAEGRGEQRALQR